MTLIEVANPKKVVNSTKHLFELVPPWRELPRVDQLVSTLHSIVQLVK